MKLPTFKQLQENLKKDFSKKQPCKIAILGNSSTDYFRQALKGFGYETDYNFIIFEASLLQIEMQIYNPDSELYEFRPDFIIILKSTQKLQHNFYHSEPSQKADFADNTMHQFTDYVSTINTTLHTKIILFNFVELFDSIYGNFGNKTPFSWIYQLRKINFGLMNLASEYNNLYINDVSALQNIYGADYIFNPLHYFSTDAVHSYEFLPVIAKNTTDIITAVMHGAESAIVLAPDNLLWRGITHNGNSDVEINSMGKGRVFLEIQLWLKNLQQRGVLLFVTCPNPEVVQNIFEDEEEMVLELCDIKEFIPDNEQLPDSLTAQSEKHNIPLQKFIYLDSNEKRREETHDKIPQLNLPELPESTADFIPYLRKLNLFEMAEL